MHESRLNIRFHFHLIFFLTKVGNLKKMVVDLID